MGIIRKRKLGSCPRERAFLHKWLLRKGIRYINKMKFVPELILDEYETDLAQHTFPFPAYFGKEERIKVIEQFIDYTLNIYPEYRKLLKVTSLYSKDVGFLLGYSSPASWNSSYNRLKYIRAIITILRIYQQSVN